MIWNVLERLRIDGEVAIPQTIRNLRQRRRQIIPTFVSSIRICLFVVVFLSEVPNLYFKWEIEHGLCASTKR